MNFSLPERGGYYPPNMTKIPSVSPTPTIGAMEGKQTHFTSAQGGLNTKLPTLPAYLYRNPSSIALSPNFIVENQHPQFVNQPLTATIKAGALDDGSQMRYDQNDLLFVFDAERDLNSGKFEVHSLWGLNYALEMAVIENTRNSKSATEMARQYSRRNSKFSNWPLTIDDFCRKISFIGSYRTSVGGSEKIRSKTIGYAWGGMISMPCIFKPDESQRYPAVGDWVFLLVKEYDNNYSGVIDKEGKNIGSPTPGKFLQVRGYWVANSRIGLLNTNVEKNGVLNPNPEDVAFKSSVTVKQVLYETNSDGSINYSKVISRDNKITYDKLQTGLLIPIGQVLRTTRFPAEWEIDAALRSKKAWNEIEDTKMDIQCKQLPFTLMI